MRTDTVMKETLSYFEEELIGVHDACKSNRLSTNYVAR
jgi:hypothetical protein